MTTSQKRQPRTLDDIHGQDYVVSFLKAAVRHPEKSPRAFLLKGAYGTGKTSLARAFAADLTGDPEVRSSQNFLEFDASLMLNRAHVENLLPYIFSEVEGWKVVLMDESHALTPEIQNLLLKPLDDSTGKVFFFFATTEESGMVDPLISRCYPLLLRTFTPEEQTDILGKVLADEELQVGDVFRRLAVLKADGHLRDLMNQIDALKLLGEQAYCQMESRLPIAIKGFFTRPGKETVETLAAFPMAYVQRAIDRFLREEIVGKQLYFRQGEISKVFMSYLRFKTLVRGDEDFYSMLFLWKESFQACLRPASV